jgi:hypothetical protein
VHTVSTATLYRLAGVAGLAGAALIAFATVRRAGLVPGNGLTHALSTPGAALSLFVLVGLYLSQRDRMGLLGLVGFALSLLGLAGVFAVEFATHAVFQFLDPDVVRGLVDGPAKPYLLTVAVVFLAGVVAFGVGLWRAGVSPRLAVAGYVVGLVPAALRTAVPEPVYLGGLMVGALAVGWLSATLLRPAPALTKINM